MTRKYYTCGLRLLSEINLPDLSPDETAAPPDISIRLMPALSEPLSAEQSLQFTESRQVLSYSGVGVFEICGIDEILVRPEPHVSEDLLSLPLLGPVLALLLHLRGRYVLHASAVNFDFGAVVFMGDKGAGKSTLAASLLRHPGARLLSDDIVVFDENQQILPGFPQMKLDKALAGELSGLGGFKRDIDVSWFPKTRLRLPYETQPGSLRVSAVYQLHRDVSPRIEPMSQFDAVRVALRFSYFIRFEGRERSPSEQEGVFRTASAIARKIRFRRLYVTNDVSRLADTQALLRADAVDSV